MYQPHRAINKIAYTPVPYRELIIELPRRGNISGAATFIRLLERGKRCAQDRTNYPTETISKFSIGGRVEFHYARLPRGRAVKKNPIPFRTEEQQRSYSRTRNGCVCRIACVLVTTSCPPFAGARLAEQSTARIRASHV